MTRIHVVGGGLAGLACAVEARHLGADVTLYEAAPQAGGRCRSVDDPKLQRRIDNGNHLLLAGNTHATNFLDRIGGWQEMREIAPAAYPFLDLRDGRRWTFRPDSSLWRARAESRLGVRDIVALARLLCLRLDRPVGQLLPPASLETLWGPLVTAVLNTPPERASAALLRAALLRVLTGGEAAIRPMVARRGLSDAFIDPALAWLRRHGATVHLGKRIDGLEHGANAVTALLVGSTRITVERADTVVLAVPPDAAARLAPDLVPALEATPILNAHFAVEDDAALPDGLPFLALVGGDAQWLFHRPGLISVTVSAADDFVDLPAQDIVGRLWREVATACGLSAKRPPCRVIKERRATIRQDPRGVARRPGCRTALARLLLAGDWTATGLPATIEGAVLSGVRAARTALA